MTLATWPTNTRQQIEEIIGMIGREVEFVTHSAIPCPNPNDSLDPITNTSTNSFCEVCSGLYWIPTYSGVSISGHVTWKFDYQNEFETGGRILIGDATVKVMHTPERESFIKHNVDYLVVDGKVMDIEKTTLLGTPINRIVINLKERNNG